MHDYAFFKITMNELNGNLEPSPDPCDNIQATSIPLNDSSANAGSLPSRSRSLHNVERDSLPNDTQVLSPNSDRSLLLKSRHCFEKEIHDGNLLISNRNNAIPTRKQENHRRDDAINLSSRHTNASNSTATSPSQVTDNVILSDTDGSSEHHSSNRGSLSHREAKREALHGVRGGHMTHFEEDDDDDDEDDEIMDASLAFNFMMEHRIFLRAALNLLTERDRYAPELGMMDPIVLRSGPLKKASHLMNGVWKVKYVEIRRGMFSYYENSVSKDSQGEGELLRKNIPLEASSVTCRAVKLHQKALALSPTGAIFEVACQGTKRLWMANSKEERSAWIQAINNAMVGGSVTRGGDSLVDHSGIVRNVSGRSPYKSELRTYLKVQSNIRNAKTKSDYISGVKELLNRSIQIPVKWIAKQGEGVESIEKAFVEASVSSSTDQLWRDMQRDSVRIDHDVFRGDAPHGPERILGALTRRILTVAGQAEGSRSDLQESQALLYARDILLAGNRTRSAGDSYYCVNALCSNIDLAVVVPSGTEVAPVEFEVAEDNSDESFQSRFIDKSGWIKTRHYLQRGWTKLFFVLSEGTLSYYVGALPRPHGLRGQRFMKETTISVNKKPASGKGKSSSHDQYILKISGEDATTKDRMLLFESEDKLLDWVYALECVAKSSTKKSSRRHSGGTPADVVEDPPIASSMVDILSRAKLATKLHAARLGIEGEELESRLAVYARKATSAVRVTVSARTDYKVCTLDPEGNDEVDTWAHITADFLQAFRVTGGPNGRIIRGEETVRVLVTKCSDITPELTPVVEGAMSPTSMRGRMNRRIFRNYGSSEELDLVADYQETKNS